MMGVSAFAQPYIHKENQQSSRSDVTTYRKADDALVGDKKLSQNFNDLNSGFFVKFYDNADEIGYEDLDRDLNLKEWGRAVTLPSVWNNNSSAKSGYSFLGGSEPTPGEFPIPSGSKCAVYQSDFTVPFDYMDKVLYFKVSGASSKATLYINGNEVGFSTDSKAMAEYEISDFVVRGRNRASIVVEEYSGGSWLEGDGSTRFSGIAGGVSMLAQPKIRVRDIIADGQLDPSYTNGLLASALLLKTELLNPHTVTVFYTLYDSEGKVSHRDHRDVRLGMRKEDTVRFNTPIPNVEKWSSETPNLYTIVYSVKREGRFTEYATKKVGFREVEIKDSKMLVNGVAPEIKGVNLKTNKANAADYFSRAELEEKLVGLRQIGVNAIRTQGVFTPSYLYDLCDSLGFYVVEQSNINTSPLKNERRTGYSLSNNPEWCDIFVDRVISSYEAVKYHPSVVALSLGEDAGNGYNMYEAYQSVKGRNAKLAVVYAGAGAEWNSDIVCPVYPDAEHIEWLKGRGVVQPIIPSEVKLSDREFWDMNGVQGAFLAAGSEARMLEDRFKNFSVEIVNAKEGVIAIENFLQSANASQYVVRYRTITRSKKSKWQTVEVNCPAGERVEVVISKFSRAKAIEVEIGNLYKKTIQNQ